MAQENVDLVLTLFGKWNSGDMDGLREMYHPDVVVRAPEGWPEPGPFVGIDNVMQQWRRMRESWDADDLQLLGDHVDAGDRVVVRFVWHGVGSGFDTDMEMSGVYTIRDG